MLTVSAHGYAALAYSFGMVFLYLFQSRFHLCGSLCVAPGTVLFPSLLFSYGLLYHALIFLTTAFTIFFLFVLFYLKNIKILFFIILLIFIFYSECVIIYIKELENSSLSEVLINY